MFLKPGDFLPYTYIGVHAPIPVHIELRWAGRPVYGAWPAIFHTLMTGTSFDLVDSASEFGTIIESEQEIVFGELIDDEPITPTILTDSTNQ